MMFYLKKYDTRHVDSSKHTKEILSLKHVCI